MLDPSPTDAALLAAHRDGDPRAFAELVGRHGDRLWSVAVRTLGSPEDAADVVQEALVSAHRRAGSFRGDAAVLTWLQRIVVNACIDRLRRVRARPPALPWPEQDVACPGADPAAELATRLAVDDALAVLPAEQRVAVVLVDVQGCAVAEAAAILDVPVGTVKSRCARGRARLAVLLGHLREELP
ncbi:MAG: RNA polymerase sigma factor SigM [Pseudonocardia sp.]